MGTPIHSWSVTRGGDKPGPHGDWHQTRGSVWGQVASELLAVTPAHVGEQTSPNGLLSVHVSRREPRVCGPVSPGHTPQPRTELSVGGLSSRTAASRRCQGEKGRQMYLTHKNPLGGTP